MRLTILGSGSSSGTPAVGAGWGRCDPLNPMNRRLRPSVLVESNGTQILIDTSPDLRSQLLAAGTDRLDAVLLTHFHADHLHGIDDLRPINRTTGRALDLFADEATLEMVHSRFGYVFEPLRTGSNGFFYKPVLTPHRVEPGAAFRVGSLSVQPFAQDHGVCQTLGFRFGSIAYSTDLIDMPPESFMALEGVDVWVLGVLTDKPHPTHAHVELALDWISRVKPKRTIFTGMGLGLDHETLRRRLPDGVEPGYDGMVVEV